MLHRRDKADFYSTHCVWGGIHVYFWAKFMLSNLLQVYSKKCLLKYNKVTSPDKKILNYLATSCFECIAP